MVVFSACSTIINGMDMLAYRDFDEPSVWPWRFILTYIFLEGLGFILPFISGVLGLLAAKSGIPNTFIAWHYILVQFSFKAL